MSALQYSHRSQPQYPTTSQNGFDIIQSSAFLLEPGSGVIRSLKKKFNLVCVGLPRSQTFNGGPMALPVIISWLLFAFTFPYGLWSVDQMQRR